MTPLMLDLEGKIAQLLDHAAVLERQATELRDSVNHVSDAFYAIFDDEITPTNCGPAPSSIETEA